MTSHVPDPLTPEERELAARLARIGPHGEPSPALDARILGAAQAAAARQPGRGRTPRWPAWVGIAATLALALGAVWQLRPMQEATVELEETPVQALMRKPAKPSVASEASMAGEAADPVAPRPMLESMRPITPPKAEVAPSPPPPAVLDEPSPMDVQPPDAPASTPPAATARSRAAQATSAAPASAQAEAAASDTPVSGIGRAATVTVTDLPVSSDRQLSPTDWIERIRQRRDAGDLAGARASLALLQRDHPGLVLPDDVRAIAPPPPDR